MNKQDKNQFRNFKGKFKDNGFCECGMCGKTNKHAGVLNPLSTDPENPPIIVCVDCMASVEARRKGISKQDALEQREKMFRATRIYQEIMLDRYLKACKKKSFDSLDEVNKATGIALNYWNSLPTETRISFDDYDERQLRELFQKMDVDFTKIETPVNPSPGKETGRNDPCPCGSGKKYKKCCLNKQPGPHSEPEKIKTDNKKDLLNINDDEFEDYWEDTLQKSLQKFEERKEKSFAAGKKKHGKIKLNQYPGDKEFDKILHEIGLSLDAFLLRSLFKDKIESGQIGGYKELLKVVLPENNIFLDEDEYKAFLECYLSLWNSLVAEYAEGKQKTSAELKTLRKKCLDLLMSNVKFIRELDKMNIDIDKLPRDLMRKLMESDTMMMGMLDLLERKPEEAARPGAAAMLETLSGVEVIIDQIKRDIYEKLGLQLKH